MDWGLFVSTFGLIFIAELPDKTAFASVLMATRHRPLPVFLGAAAAFVVQSIVAVSVGSILTLLPRSLTQSGAALLFFVLAVSMWLRKAEAEREQSGVEPYARERFSKTMASAFVVIFIAEWGDLTQLGTAALAAKSAAPFTIFTSATLALWTVSGVGVYGGHKLKRAVQPELLQRVAAIVFIAVGIALLVNVRW